MKIALFGFTGIKPGKHNLKDPRLDQADKVVEAVQNELKIKVGETTPDNKVSLLTARCIGACGIAPAVTYDGQVAAKQTPQDTLAKIKKWMEA